MVSYDKPVTDVIRVRRSWRSYRPDPVGAHDKERMRSFLSGLDCPPFGSAVRIVLADAPGQGLGRVKGTYGVITGASTFLIGVLRPSEGGHEDFGYLFEAAVLAATSLGLGTCWMGGTFSRGFFADMAHLEEGKSSRPSARWASPQTDAPRLTGSSCAPRGHAFGSPVLSCSSREASRLLDRR